MKKVLIINNAFPSASQPHKATYIKSIGELIASRDYEVIYLVLKASSRSALWQAYLVFYFRVLIFNYSRIDAVIINHLPHCALPIFLRILSLPKQTFLHWHGSEIYGGGFRSWIFKVMISLFVRATQPIHLFPSNNYREKVSSKFTIERSYVTFSGGVDLDRFKELTPKESLDIKSEVKLGIASPINDEKGFFEICQLLNTTELPVHIDFIDYGSRSVEFKAFLIRESIPHKIWPKMQKQEMIEFYNEIHILLFFTHQESLGLVGLEAIACNRPVFGFDNSGLEDYVVSGCSGELVGKSVSNQHKEKLKELVENYNRYKPRISLKNDFTSRGSSEIYRSILKRYIT